MRTPFPFVFKRKKTSEEKSGKINKASYNLGNIANYLQMFEVEHMYLPVLVNFIFIGFEGTKPLTYVLKNLSVGSQKLIMYLNTLGFYKLKKFLLHSTRTGWTEVIISIIFFLSFTSITTSLFLLSK
ncbi:hypothetical protein L1987_29211 [Smallanthus sonchifolius]|uniref:Uncharacterized protein n=1 Tax=Smallanthus sonchifolius TaxID=185202 RepID=A0ACB9HZE6_9ASTR|nr:hypothetical protein L1987_29211 [Smallanthus sonchifolius]